MLKITAEKRTITVEIASYLGEKKLYLSPKTISTYENHFHILAHLINFNQELSESVSVDLCHKVAELQISQSSKNSYLRTWRAFTRYVDPSIPSPQLRSIESIKQTYSDDDIIKLTTPPKGKYDFTEYRKPQLLHFLLSPSFFQ